MLNKFDLVKVNEADGLYITREGKIFGTMKRTGEIYEITPYLNKPTAKWKVKNGYYRFHYRGKMYQVHNLLGKYFIDGYAPNLVIDHINGDSTDNRLENLQWINRSQNVVKYWSSLTSDQKTTYKEKYAEAVKKAHAEGHYENHLKNIHKRLK